MATQEQSASCYQDAENNEIIIGYIMASLGSGLLCLTIGLVIGFLAGAVNT
jgi:hypothetical protein